MLLACLGCVEFFEANNIPPQLTSTPMILKVPPNGICFWSCLWLSTAASRAEILGWHMRPRSRLGFASFEETQTESNVVKTWAKQLPMIPQDTLDRLLNNHSAEDQDIAT